MRQRHDPEHGQTIVLFALGLVAVIAMVGLLIDGGNAYAQQRGTQNGADAAAEAGASAIARSLLAAAAGTAPTSAQLDTSVLAAVNQAAGDNRIRPFDPGVDGNSRAYYTDAAGNMLTPGGGTTTNPSLAAPFGGGAVPSCTTNCISGRAVGVRALATRQFSPFVAGAVGFGQFTASADATAVTGYAPSTNCTAAEGCALLPITFATHPAICDSTGKAVYDPNEWGLPVGTAFTGSNESILTTCKNAPGAVGWLDFGCGTLASQILNPCNDKIDFPLWVQAQPGNPNNVENELNTYAGCTVGTYESEATTCGSPAKPHADQTVQIPFFDAICIAKDPPPPNVQPDFSGGFPGTCPGSSPGGGNNTYYHVTYFLGFVLDHAYIQGNNFPECNQAPGSPLSGGNGSNGCFKGWRSFITQPPGTIVVNPGPAGPGTPLRIQLIK